MPRATTDASRRRLRLLFRLGALAACAFVVAFLLAEMPSPGSMTRGRMYLIKFRIEDYVAEHGRLPASLSDLPPLEGNRISSIVDGWKRPIHYAVNGHSVTLLTLGRDGQPGGVGEDADIEITFTVGEASSQPAGCDP